MSVAGGHAAPGRAKPVSPAVRAALAEMERDERVSVYVWDVPTRVLHWSMVFSLFALAVTGFYIGTPFISVPGGAADHFVMGTMRAIHLYAGIVFAATIVARVIWMFTGNYWARWRQFVPTTRARWGRFFETVRFYTFLQVGESGTVGHNPVAGLAYLGVYALCGVEILTGLVLWAPSLPAGSPLAVFAGLAPWLGGFQVVRWVHHVVMWLLLGFFVHHLASAMLMSRFEGNGLMGSIFSGLKFVRREDLEKELSEELDRGPREGE